MENIQLLSKKNVQGTACILSYGDHSKIVSGDIDWKKDFSVVFSTLCYIERNFLMNIVVISSAKEWGGSEKKALYTAHGLAELGHKVYFGCRGDMFQKRALKNNIQFVEFPLVNNVDVITFCKLWAFLKKKKIDVIIPSKQREYFLAGLAAKMFTSTKVAGLYGIDRPIHNFRNYIVFCYLFDIVYVNSRRIIDVLSKTRSFDAQKCRLVYGGVESFICSDTVKSRMRESLGLADDEICLMSVGRVAPQKGFDYGIKALSILVKRHPGVKLVIVGDGNIDAYKKIADECGVFDKVIFTGFRQDIYDLIQASDIFWLPSRSEGFPNAMLEAMAAMKPVVAFDVAGVAEIIINEENGIIVPFEDIEQLSEKTAYLVENPQVMKTIGKNGAETVKRKFSLDIMCKNIEKHLLELTGSKNCN